MNGIRLITDGTGRVQEIRVDVKNNPSFADEALRLLKAMSRARATRKAQTYKQVAGKLRRSQPLSPQAFHQLIQQARSSGEITAAEFFQAHPQWRRNER